MEKRVKNIFERNDVIFHDKHRSKRAVLNIVGNLASDVFGLLDSRFADEYTKDMKKLINNDEHLFMLLQNHTSIFESSIQFMMKDEIELEQHNKQINVLSKLINETMDNYEVFQYFDMGIIQLLQVISEYEHQQNAILEILTDSHKNHVNHYLFPPSEISKQIKLISESVRNKFLVPEGNDLYKIIQIIPYITERQLVFKITIPLFKLEEFHIYKIVSVPMIDKSSSCYRMKRCPSV